MSKRAKTSGRTVWRSTLRLLDAIDLGLLVLDVRGRYRYAFMEDGLAGVRRMVEGEERSLVMKRLRDLRRKKLIEERRVGTRILLGLSGRGCALHLKFQMKSAPRLPPDQRILVTFDIPERQKPVRESLRATLRKAGFKMIHYSVWMTDRDVMQPLRRHLAAKRIGGWVRFYAVREID